MHLRRVPLLVLFVCAGLVPAVTAAQTAQVGQVAGDVHDATGAALPGVTLTLTSDDRGVARTAMTDTDGRFVFAVVLPGRYTLVAQLRGFETATRTGNVVEAEKTTSLALVLQIATVRESTTIVGETPVVDPTNQTQQFRMRAEAFQKMPYGRSYQVLIGQTPGLVYNSDGNPNTHGALRSNNIFLFDGVNTTDPTAGTVGNSITYEAIAEVVVRTSAISAEFGRATGAIVDVITRSGTNQLQGMFKFLAANDAWNTNNSARSEVADAGGAFASLARTRFDRVNPTYSGTFGGPVRRNNAWFFAAFEHAEAGSPARQTNAAPGFANENFQQITKSPYVNLRVTAQVAPAQQVWVKIVSSPTRGFINDYWGAAAEREALTAQHQGGFSWATQYSGVFGTKWTGEVMASAATMKIDVVPFERSALNGGAPHQDQVDGRFYNGATFDGYVRRPRQQASAALTYWMNARHQIKFGTDWQASRSESAFRFPMTTLYLVSGFNPVTREFTPIGRLEYDDTPSESSGTQFAFYVRDRMQWGTRGNLEVGLRAEHQTAQSDLSATTVRATTFSPRVSASVLLTEDARHIAVGSYGRMYDAILLGFSDAFAGVPQQTNYDLFLWNGADYVFDSRFEQGPSSFQPNPDVSPRHLDEFTIGTEHRLGATSGVSVRYVHRVWGNFVDDVRAFGPDGAPTRVVQNINGARRNYRGVELVYDRRLADNWTASWSYTYSRTRGNHFGDDFTAFGDYVNETCQQDVDPGLGDAAGRFPCADVQATLDGTPAWDRPHFFKMNGAYLRRVGPVDLATGVVANVGSKTTYTKSRTVNVLQPASGLPSGQTLTYFYEPRGTDRVAGTAASMDLSVEGTMRTHSTVVTGLKFDVFNVFNAESKINVNNTAWCASTATEACAGIVSTYGTATARGSFMAPRTVRLTVVLRWQ